MHLGLFEEPGRDRRRGDVPGGAQEARATERKEGDMAREAKAQGNGPRDASRRKVIKLATAGGVAAGAMGLPAAQVVAAQIKKPVREVFKGTW